MLHIWDLRVDEAPSSGITAVGEDVREMVDGRELTVRLVDLCGNLETLKARVDTLPGILYAIELKNRRVKLRGCATRKHVNTGIAETICREFMRHAIIMHPRHDAIVNSNPNFYSSSLYLKIQLSDYAEIYPSNNVCAECSAFCLNSVPSCGNPLADGRTQSLRNSCCEGAGTCQRLRWRYIRFR